MTFLHVFILSVIEGITEFLPISSTGHMILASKLLGVANNNFTKSFEIYIQLGAILAVSLLYVQKLLKNPKLIKPIIIAFVPAGIIGFVLYKMIREILLGNSLITVISLFTGGVVLLFIEKMLKRDEAIKSLDTLSVKSALVIGFFQAVSIIPGVSRSAASIIGGLKEGLTKEQAVEFSFLLAIPTVMGATLLDLVKAKFHFSSSEWGMLAMGTVISFITAWITVKFFLNFVKNHSFKVFGIYRIVLAVIYFLFFLH